MCTRNVAGIVSGLALLLAACGPGPGSQAAAESVCAAYETALFHGDYHTMYALLAPVADEVFGGQVQRGTLDSYLPDWQKAHAKEAGGKVQQVEVFTPLLGSAVSKNCTAYYSLPGKLTIQQDTISVDELADGKWYVDP